MGWKKLQRRKIKEKERGKIEMQIWVSKGRVDSSDYWLQLYIYVVPSISFHTFLVQAFNMVVDSWKFNMLLL